MNFGQAFMHFSSVTLCHLMGRKMCCLLHQGMPTQWVALTQKPTERFPILFMIQKFNSWGQNRYTFFIIFIHFHQYHLKIYASVSKIEKTPELNLTIRASLISLKPMRKLWTSNRVKSAENVFVFPILNINYILDVQMMFYSEDCYRIHLYCVVRVLVNE